MISIIGVYLPSSNIPLEEYCEYMSQLEELITMTMCQKSGEVVTMGDFNAHTLLKIICVRI